MVDRTAGVFPRLRGLVLATLPAWDVHNFDRPWRFEAPSPPCAVVSSGANRLCVLVLPGSIGIANTVSLAARVGAVVRRRCGFVGVLATGVSGVTWDTRGVSLRGFVPVATLRGGGVDVIGSDTPCVSIAVCGDALRVDRWVPGVDLHRSHAGRGSTVSFSLPQRWFQPGPGFSPFPAFSACSATRGT